MKKKIIEKKFYTIFPKLLVTIVFHSYFYAYVEILFRKLNNLKLSCSVVTGPAGSTHTVHKHFIEHLLDDET